MKKINFNKRHFFRRMLAMPFVFVIMLLAHLGFVFHRTWHFFLYGGEYVNYEENERENLKSIYEMLKEIKEKQP